jgi:hypothetical protein
MSETEAQRLAGRLGLAKLDERQLQQFARGIQSAHELVAKLPKDLHWSEEAALPLLRPNSPRPKR